MDKKGKNIALVLSGGGSGIFAYIGAIEALPIPYRAIATDLYTGKEVVFDKGKFFTAIRASYPFLRFSVP